MRLLQDNLRQVEMERQTAIERASKLEHSLRMCDDEKRDLQVCSMALEHKYCFTSVFFEHSSPNFSINVPLNKDFVLISLLQ